MSSLKTKMAASFGVLLLIVCITLATTAYFVAGKVLEAEARSSLANLANQGAKTVQSRIEEQLNALEAIAGMREISDTSIPWEEKLIILSKEVERNGHIRMGIADKNGNMQATDGTNINISDRAHFINPMAGKSFVSDPIISKANGSIILSYGVPIKNNNEIVGVLVAVRDGNALSNIADDITFGKSGKANIINKAGTTIAHRNRELVLEMHNVTEAAKKDPTLAPLAELHKQMTEGKKGSGEYVYNGIKKIMGFAPIQGTSWSLAVEAPKDEVLSDLSSLQRAIIQLSLLILLAGIIIAYTVAAGIARPVIRAANLLSVTATGDFTQAISPSDKKRKDEIGLLIRSIDTMQSAIKAVVHGVIEEASNVATSVAIAAQNMAELNDQIEEVSATTEQLSAGMEETAASTEEMNATSVEIESAIESIAGKAQEGALAAREISKRANELKLNAVESQQSANEIYVRTEEKLKKAIEHSKAVEQINVLSDAILQITSKTNLLALNASIEAARAGEAGKGFTVVANEIRKLAEDSKNVVSEIQNITNEVISSVANLSESSEEILEFINQKVLHDYKSMVNTGNQYNKDAELIDNMVTDFSATSEQLAASVQNMIKAINEITSAANEGATGTSHIAQKVSVVVEKASEVISQGELSRESSDRLAELVSRFKI